MTYEQYESAANIEFTIDSETIPIMGIDTTKDVEIDQIRGNSLKPIGYSITEISYSGSMDFDGNGIYDGERLEEKFTDSEGVPKDGATITITHENEGGESTDYEDVMVVSDGYETASGDVSSVTFDWIASDRNPAGGGDGD